MSWLIMSLEKIFLKCAVFSVLSQCISWTSCGLRDLNADFDGSFKMCKYVSNLKLNY